MAVEFDHIFICTDIGAPIADQLITFGLQEGLSNIHVGQGTANRCFFFHNAMLELLWVYDPTAAQSEIIQRTHLWERWEDRNRLCPFGICLRSKDSAILSHWDYRPPYMPENLSIAVATNSEILTEPMIFQTPFAPRLDQVPSAKAQLLRHPVGLQEITRVEIISPVSTPISPELQAVIDSNQIKFRYGSAYGVELGFDHEKQGQVRDFRPTLPLLMTARSLILGR
jgi:hypothetical protein